MEEKQHQQEEENRDGSNEGEIEKPTWKKKKIANRKQIRTRPSSDTTIINNKKDKSDEDDVLEKLSTIREAQALRASFKRRGGIQVDSTDSADGYAPEPKRSRDNEGNEIASSTTSDGKYLAGLNSSHAARAGDITDHTSRMEKYIQQKINEFQESCREQEIREQKIRQGASLDEWDKSTFGGNYDSNNNSAEMSTSANDGKTKYESYEEKQRKLYEIPEEYKTESKLIKDSQNKIAWITGISEVELPLSYKLKNIQETEEAKKKLLSNPVIFKSTDRKLYRFTNVLDKDTDEAKGYSHNN